MSESTCPILTDKDIELIHQHKEVIAEIISSEPILGEYLNTCNLTQKNKSKSVQSGGTLKDKLIGIITSIIVLCITAAGAGASSAFFLTVIPERWQLIILTLVNRTPSLPVCMTVTDYAMGMAQSLFNPAMSCAARAELFEQGITRINMAAAAATGTTALLLHDRIKTYITRLIDGRNVPAITDTDTTAYSIVPSNTKYNPRKGGSKRYRKSRRNKKTRRH